MPEWVFQGLATPDPEIRSRVLDHWETKESKVPLDDATGDQDATVRARATAIIERLWDAEQYVLDLTFSTTGNTGSQLITRVP